jgi:hypothetical protein
MKDFLKSLKVIKLLDTGTALGSGFLGIFYLFIHFFFPVIFPLEYLYIVAILGGLLGFGLSRSIESSYKYLINQKPDKLKEFQTDKIILNDKLKSLNQSVELGFISESETKEIAKKLLKEHYFGTSNNQRRLTFNNENEEQYLPPNDTINNDDEEQDSPPNDSL